MDELKQFELPQPMIDILVEALHLDRQVALLNGTKMKLRLEQIDALIEMFAGEEPAPDNVIQFVAKY